MSEGNDLVRPFMGRVSAEDATATAARTGAAPTDATSHDALQARTTPAEPTSGDDSIRPYLITGGRVRASRDIRIETQVRTSRFGAAAFAAQTFERAEILDLCAQPMSVAEISAKLRLPLGVSRVLVSDLRGEGFVNCSDSPADVGSDAAMIRRLIDGVRAL